jgi:hypothetical protein
VRRREVRPLREAGVWENTVAFDDLERRLARFGAKRAATPLADASTIAKSMQRRW